jgi:hypothetical protein
VCLLALVCAVPAHALAQDAIAWSAARKLTRSDFQGRVPATASSASMSAISIDAEWECKGSTLVSSVRANFQPGRSWWRNTPGGVWAGAGERMNSSQAMAEARRNTVQRDAQLLEHEQLHFDLAEVTVRRMRAQLAKYANACGEAGDTAPIQQMVVQHDRELQEEQQRYDRDTAHGTNVRAQHEWMLKIRKALAE